MKGVRITGNRVYGFTDEGFYVKTGACPTLADDAAEDAANVAEVASADLTGEFIFANNYVMGGKVGLVVVPYETSCS